MRNDDALGKRDARAEARGYWRRSRGRRREFKASARGSRVAPRVRKWRRERALARSSRAARCDTRRRPASSVAHDLVLDLFALGERAEPTRVDLSLVDKDVAAAAGLGSDEAVALDGVEPFHRALHLGAGGDFARHGHRERAGP